MIKKITTIQLLNYYNQLYYNIERQLLESMITSNDLITESNYRNENS